MRSGRDSGLASSEITMSTIALKGIIPAFPTPLTPAGQLDRDALHRLVEHQIEHGASGLVPLGGTGEFASLSAGIRNEVIAETVAAVRQRVPVIAGVLSPGYSDAVDAGRAFMDAGADALMVIPPYYVKATQETVISYFTGYQKDVGAPVVLYDNPARSHFVLTAQTIAHLYKAGAICGMKASSLDLYHFDHIMERVDDGFAMLGGQDTLYAQQVAMGAVGGILTSAVLTPSFWVGVQSLVEGGDVKAALKQQRRLNALMDALFAEENPMPVKAALGMMGLEMGRSVLPLGNITPGLMTHLGDILAKAQSEGLVPQSVAALQG
jgi:4-hydroxy-tetrahydrodipicolinate synthase